MTTTLEEPHGGTLSDGAAIAEAVAAVRSLDAAARTAVAALQRLDGRRAAAEEGMAVDTALRLHTRAAGGDVATLVTAADVLRRLPATAALFADGVLSWGHVRQLVAGARRFDAATCGELDAHLAERAERLVRLDPDQLADVLDDAVVAHQRLASVEARHDREVEANRFVLQPRFDGTATSWGEWDREAAALLADALHTEADAPQTTPCPGGGKTPPPTLTVRSRPQQLADALLRLVTRGRSGADGPTPPARFTVMVDADAVTDHSAAVLLTALRGRPPRIVRRALDRLSCDAAIDAVVRDGVDLVAAQRYAPEVTAAARRAVTARDGGCRFPGCTAPVAWCDLHHVTPRAQGAASGHPGGDHAVGNLVLLCRRHHTLVHRRSWRQQLSADGTYTVRRRGRSWTTSPRNAALLPRLPSDADRRPRPRAGPEPPSSGREPPPGREPPRSPGTQVGDDPLPF